MSYPPYRWSLVLDFDAVPFEAHHLTRPESAAFGSEPVQEPESEEGSEKRSSAEDENGIAEIC